MRGEAGSTTGSLEVSSNCSVRLSVLSTDWVAILGFLSLDAASSLALSRGRDRARFSGSGAVESGVGSTGRS